MTDSNTTTQPRRRILRPRNIMLLLIGAILAPIIWFAVDIWLVFTDAPEQSSAFHEQMTARCAERQPEGENGWSALTELLDEFHSIETELAASLGVDYIYDEKDAAELILAQDAALDDAALLARIDQVLAYPRFVRPWQMTDMPPAFEILEYIGPARSLGHVLARRAVNCAQRGDWPGAVQAFNLNLRLGKIPMLQPMFIEGIVGISAQSEGMRAMRKVITEMNVPTETVAAFESVLATVPDDFSSTAAFMIENARLITRENLRWTHGSRGYALPMVTLLERDRWSGDGDPRSLSLAISARWVLATNDECGQLADRWYDEMQQEAKLPFAKRADEWPPPALLSLVQSDRFVALEQIEDLAPIHPVTELDRLLLERRSTLIMCAIKRYQAACEALPSTLDELVGAWIDELPTDPLSGSHFGYRVLAGDEELRYLLYSFGPDGVDNGGRLVEEGESQHLYNIDDGYDYAFD